MIFLVLQKIDDSKVQFMVLKKYLQFDIILIAVIHLAGIIGIRFVSPEIFLKTSFVSIVIPLGLYMYRTKPNFSNYLILLLVYFVTFFSEWIGVNFSYLFGNYEYGNSLGLKIDGVPILIGLNWVLLAVVSREISANFFSNKWIIILISSVMMVLIDSVIEPISEKLDFWTWENSIIPFSNYKDWFLVALINQWLLSFIKSEKDMFHWSLAYLIILILFFASFYI